MTNKIDENLTTILEKGDGAHAIVRVRNVFQLQYIKNNFEVVSSFPFIRSVGIKCDKNAVKALEVLPSVEYVSAQSVVKTFENNALDNEKTADLLNFADFENSTANVLSSNSRLTGKGVRLCVLDTGVAPHSDVSIPRERIVHFEDFVNGKDYPYDDNGHGTFVSGVAVGNGLLSSGKISGVAPNCEIVGVKVIEQNGETGAFKILDGMQWLYDNFRRYGIKVVCMSFGADPVPSSDPLKIGAEMLVKAGLTVVCAVGNSGESALKSPAISSEVISVGACDDNFNIAEFSSFGTYKGVMRPDVYARGVDINGLKAYGTYQLMSGTSVSAPYVAGLCCLLYEKYPRMTPAECKRMLLSFAKNVNGIKTLI